jgi:protein kinase X
MGKDPVDFSHQDVQALIQSFFQQEHTEGGKVVSSSELLTIRPETIGEPELPTRSAWRARPGVPTCAPLTVAPRALAGGGKFSRVQLVEVKVLPKYLAGLMGVELDESKRGDVSVAPEVSSGVFAMKVMKKTEVVRLKEVDHVKHEADLLSRLMHPFIVTLYHRFQDERKLYLIEEFVQSGTLSSHIQQNGNLCNENARFYAAQIVMAMQYLHGEHVIYRDLHPENVMLDRGRYVKLVDFGLAKAINLDDPTARTWTLCGQPEYLAPEIITSKGYSKEVDWWALGIVTHEMLAGYPPYFAKEAFEIYKMVTNAATPLDFPQHLDQHARDLIKKLLVKDRGKRIGSSKHGAEDIKKHKWYRGLNWAALYNKNLAPPEHDLSHISSIDSPLDISNFASYPTSSDDNGPAVNPKDDELFAGFDSSKAR